MEGNDSRISDTRIFFLAHSGQRLFCRVDYWNFRGSERIGLLFRRVQIGRHHSCALQSGGLSREPRHFASLCSRPTEIASVPEDLLCSVSHTEYRRLAGIVFLADWIVKRFFGQEYLRTIVMLKIWALALMPLTPFAIFFASSLIPCNGSKEYLKTLLTGAILTLAVTPFLLHEFGIISVPFSQASIECCNVVLGGLYLKQKLKLDGKEFLSMINVRQAFRDGHSILFGIDGLLTLKRVSQNE